MFLLEPTLPVSDTERSGPAAAVTYLDAWMRNILITETLHCV